MFGKKIFYGWYIVAASLLIIILDGMLLYSFGVFLPYLNDDFGLSRATGSSIFSFRSLVQAPAFILAGRLIDKFDPRAVVLGGGSIAALGMIFAGLAVTSWQLYLSYGLMVGVGDAVLYITCVALVSRWFVSKRPLAIGIITTGVPLSGLITNPLTAWLIKRFRGEKRPLRPGRADVHRADGELRFKVAPRRREPPPLRYEAREFGGGYRKGRRRGRTEKGLEGEGSAVYAVLLGDVLYVFPRLHDVPHNRDAVLQLHDRHRRPRHSRGGPPAAIGLGSIIGRTVLSSLLAEVLEFRKVILICFIAQGAL